MTDNGDIPQTSDGPGNKPVPKGQARERGAVSAREDRLKAALKANMARRKAQARARAAAAENDTKKE
jgi:hypothetical protein